MGGVPSPIGSVYLGGDDDLDPASVEDIDDTLLCIIGAVREQCAETPDHLGQEGIGTVEIVQVARCQVEGDRIAECIAQRVQLGAQSAFAAPDRFCGVAPPFAPALA